jgi:glycosyltransferase involved in cell wall biosynthesis
LTYKSIEDLIEKIKTLLNDEQANEKLREGARNYAEKNSWGNIAKQHVALYSDVLKK